MRPLSYIHSYTLFFEVLDPDEKWQTMEIRCATWPELLNEVAMRHNFPGYRNLVAERIPMVEPPSIAMTYGMAA